LANWHDDGEHVVDLGHPVSELGAVKERLLEIVKALAFDAELVIMDEPGHALLNHDRAKLFDYIRKMRAMGTSVLLVMHPTEEVIGLADRVTVLRDGLQVGTMTAQESSNDNIICQMVRQRMGSRSVASLFGDMPSLEERSAHIQPPPVPAI
jgi:ribose transport system ATP-binding protein